MRNFFLKVLSWNMQGGSYEKIEYINKRRANDHILLLGQETGVPDRTGLATYESRNGFTCMAAYVDEAARNQRCTTAMFCSDEINQFFRTGRFGYFASSPFIYRPVVISQIFDINIATFHATANDATSVSEVCTILRAFIDAYGNIDSKWILMGDFNAEPSRYGFMATDVLKPGELNKIRVRGTERRHSENDYCYMLYSPFPTQGANGYRTNNLDYVFMSCSMVESGILMPPYLGNCMICDEMQNPVSDHNCIAIDLNLSDYVRNY